MRMFMLAVLVAAILVPVGSGAQSSPADSFYRGFKQGEDIGRSLAPLLRKRPAPPPRQPPPQPPPRVLTSPVERQPKEVPLNFAEALDNPGFEEYVRKLMKVSTQDAEGLQETLLLMAERREFFIRRAEAQWDNETRVIRHMFATALKRKEAEGR